MGKDPYKYFRIEARELLDGLSRGVLQLEKGIADHGLVATLLRLAHTLKGAARVVRQPGIADLAHGLEDLLAPHREAPGPVERERIDALLRLLDSIASALASLGASPAPLAEGPSAPPPHASVEDHFEQIRVDVEEMDSLLLEISGAAVRLGELRKGAEGLERVEGIACILLEQLSRRRGGPQAAMGAAAVRARCAAEEMLDSLRAARRVLAVGLERAEADLQQVRAQANRVRLVPISAIFGSLERTARDTARSLRKQVRFETSGGEIRVDGHVLSALRDALLHVVRNAVDHGIEPDSERLAAGKPAEGNVAVAAERRGDRLAFLCSDDGRGIDLEAVRRSAVERGYVTSERAASLSEKDCSRLIFQAGVSGSAEVTAVSGRGVGLDVVREIISRFRGETSVRTGPGRGTTIEIRVPMSLSSLTAVQMRGDGAVVSIPLDSVQQALWSVTSEIARSPEGDSILLDGAAVPFASLGKILWGRDPEEGCSRAGAAVVVRSGGALAAIGVDQLLGTAEVVVRPLPAILGSIPTVAGTCLDAEGSPQLVLDPASLVLAARAQTGRAHEPASAQVASVLVVDDSLTTRMLEQSILESAGFEVDLAASGEEAFRKARERSYSLFIVDIEMPGMNGFDFISRTRTDAALGRIPAILLTSRSSSEERRKGIEAGASAYIVKSEFDQGRFLDTIRSLIA